MRVLTILVGMLLLAAPLCCAQSAPTPSADTIAPDKATPGLQQQLEEFKAQYGKAQLNEHRVSEVVLSPKPGRRNLNVSGDSRAIFNAIATAFGLRASFDESVPTKFVRFNLENVDFNTAAEAAALMTKTFWFPKATDEIFVAADTAQKHRDLEPVLERTFYLSDVSSAQELTDVVNLIRTIFEVRFIAQQPGSNSITVRTDQRSMHSIERLIDNLNLSRPQVMLKIQAIEVDSLMQRNLGINLPLEFQMFNIPVGVLALLNTPGIQNLISQLGTSNLSGLANSSSVAALLAQYQNQLQSLLANPIATFGGGLTFMGVSIPATTANFSLNQSSVRDLEQLTLRASDGNAATVHIGNRFPVLTQSFSSGINVTGLNIGVVGAVPGFTYEDLGVTLKATPKVHGTSDVTLDMETSIKSLGAQSVNSIPIIQNREYKGMITVKEGETAVIAGMVSKTEQMSLMGPPGIGSLPVLNKVLSSETKMDDRTELIILVTPYIVKARTPGDTPMIVAAPAR